MNIIKNYFVIVTILLSISIISYAQEIPVKWGDIKKENLKSTSFPADSNASAIILCDYGESKFDDRLNIIFSRILRVKILNKKGYGLGTNIIQFNTENEEINNIEGVTYFLNENNDIIKQELNDDDIYEEEVSENISSYKFTMPGLKPGCIYEIKYEKYIQSISSMPDWVFQHSEPTLWSEYRIKYPEVLDYMSVNVGYEPFYKNEINSSMEVFKGEALSLLEATGNMVVCYNKRWVIKDLPAIREEPYVKTLKDYKSRVDIQFSGYKFRRGGGEKRFLNDWESVVKELLENDNFYYMLDDTKDISKLTSEITANIATPKQKINAIYDWIKKTIVWNGNNRVFAYTEPDDLLEIKKGSNAEITFLLLSMLKSIGIECRPVILSTRDNGKIQNIYPIMNQFNYVLSEIDIGNESFYVDATNSKRPIDLLPNKVLNVPGLVIKPGEIEWVQIEANKSYYNKSLLTVNLKEDGELSGQIIDAYYDYGGLDLSNRLKDQDTLKLIENIFRLNETNAIADSIKIVENNAEKSKFVIQANLSSDDYVQINGNLIYLNPNFIHLKSENPFKSRTRVFPIDFSHPYKNVHVININLPNGIEIVDTINEKSIHAANGGITYLRHVKCIGNNIQIMSKFEIKQVEIQPDYYPQVKELYSQIIATEAEQFVFRKVL